MDSPKRHTRQRRDHRAGFTLVEVLIATLIMVMSIVTVTAAIRQFAIHREKLRQYEQLYTTTLSLRDKIMNDTLTDNFKDSGKLNGLYYHYECKLVERANSYALVENPEQGGNSGQYSVTLFKVNLEVEGKGVEFYKTQYKKRFETPKDQF